MEELEDKLLENYMSCLGQRLVNTCIFELDITRKTQEYFFTKDAIQNGVMIGDIRGTIKKETNGKLVINQPLIDFSIREIACSNFFNMRVQSELEKFYANNPDAPFMNRPGYLIKQTGASYRTRTQKSFVETAQYPYPVAYASGGAPYPNFSPPRSGPILYPNAPNETGPFTGYYNEDGLYVPGSGDPERFTYPVTNPWGNRRSDSFETSPVTIVGDLAVSNYSEVITTIDQFITLYDDKGEHDMSNSSRYTWLETTCSLYYGPLLQGAPEPSGGVNPLVIPYFLPPKDQMSARIISELKSRENPDYKVQFICSDFDYHAPVDLGHELVDGTMSGQYSESWGYVFGESHSNTTEDVTISITFTVT